MLKRLQVIGPSGGRLEFIDLEESEGFGIFHPNEGAMSAARTSLLAAVERLCDATYDWEYRGQDERDKVLNDLREYGAKLLTALAGARPREELIAILSRARHLTALSDHHLPWEFLYLGDVDKPASVRDFFGSNAVVGKHFEKRSNKRSSPSTLSADRGPLTRLPNDVAVEFRYAEDSRLPSATSGAERAIFERLGVNIINLPALSDTKASRDQLHHFMGASEHLTHFNCHADPEIPAESEGAIFVTRVFKIDKRSIAELDLNESSIIVLNCCSSHTMRHDVQETVASEFRNKRVEAVVATTGNIEDAYGTRWAGHFYRALCGGQTAAQSILTARHAMLEETHPNLSALLYAYIGRPSAALRTRLVA